MKHSVSRDCFVHYAHLLAAWMIHEPPGELIGPPLVGIGGGLRTITSTLHTNRYPTVATVSMKRGSLMSSPS
jgi:hypothetical protein